MVAIGALEALFVTVHLLRPDVSLLDLDAEFTAPAWFSALQLAAIGATCFFAFEAERRDGAARSWQAWVWPVLGLGFLYLSADEALVLHERVLVTRIRAFFPADSLFQGVLPWQLVFAPGILAAFVVIAAVLQTRLAALPWAKALGLLGLGFWTMSFIFEGAAKPYFMPAGLYRIEVALEEACEMLGATAILGAFAYFAITRSRETLPVGQLHVGRVLLAAGGFATVAGVAILALTLSNPVYLHRRAGDKFVDTKQYDRALVAYAEAAARGPDDADVWRRMGRAAMQARDYDKAREAFARAAALAPDDETMQNDLGVVLHRTNRLAEAEQAYRRAIEIKPTYAQAFRNLGILYEKQGDLTRSEQAYRTALEQDDEMADAHRELGSLLWRDGRLVEAREHWQKSLTLEPEQRGAVRLQRRLRGVSKAPSAAEARPGTGVAASPPSD
jgi:tetratricopeptide (TPR) repeat protein